jgi:hypothetical protein
VPEESERAREDGLERGNRGLFEKFKAMVASASKEHGKGAGLPVSYPVDLAMNIIGNRRTITGAVDMRDEIIKNQKYKMQAAQSYGNSQISGVNRRCEE